MKKPWTYLEGIAVDNEARQDVYKVPGHLCAVAAMPIKHAKEAGGLGAAQVLLDNKPVLQGSLNLLSKITQPVFACDHYNRSLSKPDSVSVGRADLLLLLTSRHTAP